ncbi:MAG: adenylate/guanylate cyclase domain-containing protein [Rhizobiaceae bacterium]
MSDIVHWLTGLGLEKYVSAFSEAEIDFEILSDLVEEDLNELGLPLGPRRKIWGAIKRLGDASALVVEEPNDSINLAPTSQDTAPSSDAERRHLTVMFVDLVGSTEMATKIDPEDMRNVITNYQNTIAGIVTRYEGFVAKFMGDGVLCYFGWPRANEDDAERAVRAGLAMIAAVKDVQGPNGGFLSTRVGIATGVVIVGDLIGSGATQEAAVVGETPNLAARLQGLAQPNQLVLPQETLSLLGNVFETQSLGSHTLKGISELVQAFGVVGESTEQSRFEARQQGVLTPIVGREREIELMLERWTRAKSAAGQMIIVSGEAGIGKSRITRAVIDAITQDDHIRMNYQCSPYHTDSAFYPIIQQLSHAAGLKATDGAEARLDKLEALIGDDDAETVPLVASLLGLNGIARYGELNLSPAQQRARTMQMLVRLMVRQSQDKPLLMIFEDLHWVDPTTLELLDLTLDEIADQPILILATARPTFEHGFGGHPIVTRFALNRLGKDQIAAIASKLTGGKTLPNEIMEIIASRTDGVPLFVEELTKTILESGALKDEGDRFVLDGPLSTIAIPNTLHDSLMARLDRLQPIKEVAQTAACIGREFDHSLLAQISHLPETELNTSLDGLIKAELIYRRGLPPEATYLFKHALVRDAAYESLLKEKRRAIHANVVTALENQPDVAPELLAYHTETAGQTDRAIELWETASKVAIARPAYDEGISHLKHAIALIKPNVDGGDRAAIEHALSLQVQLGMALLTRIGYGADETIAAFEYALTLADKVGETPMRYSILYGLWIAKGIRGEHAEALKRTDAMIEQATKSSDTAPLVVANRVAGATRFIMGDLAGASHYMNIALEHFDPVAHGGLANRYGQDIGVTINIFMAFQAQLQSQTRQARIYADEAERLAKSTGHIQTICYMLLTRSLFEMQAGVYSEAERCTAEVIPIAEEHKMTLWLEFSVMSREVLAARNGNKISIQRYLKADAALIATKVKMFVPQLRIEAGWCALALGLRGEATELAAMAQELIETTGENYTLSDLHRLQATLAKADGDLGAAEKHLNSALDVARKQGAKYWELRAAIDLARLWGDAGRTDDAIALLKPIHDVIAFGDCVNDCFAASELLSVWTE